MQRYRIHKRVSRLFRLEFGCPPQFGNGPIAALEACERQSECMMQTGVPWRGVDGGPQDFLSVTILTALAIEIGEIDCRGRKLRAQPKGGFVFGFRLGRVAAPGEEGAQR